MTEVKEVAHFESLYPAESRFNEIGKMLEFLKHGHSCQIVGLPGTGQSTFLKLLAYNKAVRIKHLQEEQERFHFVLTNFSEVRKRPLVDITKFMFLTLADSLRERNLQEEYEKTYSIFKESIILNDELVMFQGLKNAVDYLTLEKGMTIVYLMDRFEEYIPLLTDDFFSNLRVLRNRAKYKFSAVFSVDRPLEDSIEPVLMADFYDFLAGHTVYLPLKDHTGMEFRMKHLEEITGKTVTESLRKTLLNLTGGMGRLTKNSLQAILSAESVGEQDLSSFLLSQPSVQSALYEIWRALSPSEQDFLLSNTTYPASDQDYPYLANIGLLKDGVITIPLLQEFLQQSLKTVEQQAGLKKISYNPETDTITQGKVTLSDKLTSAEFKLLRLLLEHPETVIDRETIINAVWKESVSTAGVTDQALDQLLFRVRKKIEDDPNNPHHIQTVKGRGIRFTP
jgi:DNA-binding winged helix-turn-helix (wHTH) protein